MLMKRTIPIVLAILAAMPFTLDKIGGRPIIEGYETGFRSSSSVFSDGKKLDLSIDPANRRIECKLFLLFNSSTRPVVSTSSKSDSLLANTISSGNKTGWVEITNFVKDSLGNKYFNWNIDFNLILQFDSPKINMSDLTIEDWEIDVKGEQYDSLGRQRRRRILFWCSIVFILAAVILVSYEKLAESKEKLAINSNLIIISIIASVEAENRKSTKNMRLLLKKVLLQSLSVNTALKSLGSKEDYDGMAFFFEASDQFIQMLDGILDQLNDYREKVPKKDLLQGHSINK